MNIVTFSNTNPPESSVSVTQSFALLKLERAIHKFKDMVIYLAC